MVLRHQLLCCVAMSWPFWNMRASLDDTNAWSLLLMILLSEFLLFSCLSGILIVRAVYGSTSESVSYGCRSAFIINELGI